MEFLKSITGRVVTGLVALGVIAAGISWWQMDESTRQMLVSGTGRILGWFGVVLAWPWVSFALISPRGTGREQRCRGGAGRGVQRRGNRSAGVAFSLASAQCHGLDVSVARRTGVGGI